MTPQFAVKDLRAQLLKRVEAIQNALMDLLQQIGEQFIIDARTTNTYKDRTRNLRGSVGYVILKDGIEVFSNFQGTEIGKKAGESLAQQIGSSSYKGFVLIVVAGMDYAAYVEAMGFDVLTGSSLKAERNLKKGIAKVKTLLKNAA